MPIEPTVVETSASAETLKAMAQKKHKEIFELKELIKQNKEKIELKLRDDKTYDSLVTTIDTKTKDKRDRRKYLIQQQELEGELEIIKEQQEELKDAKAGLSSYLVAIHEKTKQLTFDDYLGNKRMFNIGAKPGKLIKDEDSDSEGGE